MKAKTHKKFQRIVVLLLVLVFVGGTLLLYLPVGQPANPQYTPPPLNSLPDAQQNQPAQPGGAAATNAPAP